MASSSSSFGELVLVLGDLHIPSRVTKIPAQFKRMLVPNKMQHVLCTGNVGTSIEQYDELYNLAPNVHIVGGNYDINTTTTTANDSATTTTTGGIGIGGSNNNAKLLSSFPEIKILQIGLFKIGIIHGHQLLPWDNVEAAVERFQRKYQVDIVITGHTHKSVVHVKNNYYHINPGSITGAYTSLISNEDDIIPSFILLAVQDTKITCYVYELIKGDVEVSKTEFTKHIEEKISHVNLTNPTLLDTLLK